MSTGLNGYGALVVGGGGGFGAAAARRLAADGAEVTIGGRTESSLRETAERIAEELPKAPRVRCQVGDAGVEDDVRAMVAAVDGAPLRICVTVVGGGSIGPLLMLDEQVALADFDRNTLSALRVIRYAGSAMAASEGGSIVCTSSTAGEQSFPQMAAYTVAKAALDALVRVAADELGALGVRVNAVRPGLVDTGAAKPGMLVQDPEQRAIFLREKPLGRLGTPGDVAEAIRFLAGPESSWITGVSLPVDGGNHLRRGGDLEPLARSLLGDAVIDAAKEGSTAVADQT